MGWEQTAPKTMQNLHYERRKKRIIICVNCIAAGREEVLRLKTVEEKSSSTDVFETPAV